MAGSRLRPHRAGHRSRRAGRSTTVREAHADGRAWPALRCASRHHLWSQAAGDPGAAGSTPSPSTTSTATRTSGGGRRENDSGWSVCGGAGGSGYPLPRSEPWVNLAGWSGPGCFYAGGQLLAAEHVDSVRLTTRDGTVLHDDTTGGIVLFLTARTVEVPVVLELRDIDERTIAKHLALDLDGRRR
jgi:hypothetical protein